MLCGLFSGGAKGNRFLINLLIYKALEMNQKLGGEAY